MLCEFSYCIYNRDNKCIVKKIAIDALGMCSECIRITVNHKTLEKMKEEQLTNLINREKLL